MSISTTYKCDRCAHEQDNATQMWNVSIGFGHLSGNYSSSYCKKKEQLWCRSCMDKFDLLEGEGNPKNQTPPIVVPTLEDIIRELCRDEITNMTGAS